MVKEDTFPSIHVLHLYKTVSRAYKLASFFFNHDDALRAITKMYRKVFFSGAAAVMHHLRTISKPNLQYFEVLI